MALVYNGLKIGAHLSFATQVKSMYAYLYPPQHVGFTNWTEACGSFKKLCGMFANGLRGASL